MEENEDGKQGKQNLNRSAKIKNFKECDVLIVGGINGAAVAASLSARGYKVALVEQGDYAAKTSQASSNLVWGGIKYLENLEFVLVRNLCRSRNKLMKAYPSLIREVRFFIPFFGLGQNGKSFKRHPFILKLGTWFYWFIGSCFTRPPKTFTLNEIGLKEYPLKDKDDKGGGAVVGALEYSDAYLPENDARFVYRLLDRAERQGALLLNYVRFLKREKNKEEQLIHLEDGVTKLNFSITAKWMINASGPWVDELSKEQGLTMGHCHVFSKGVHLVFKKIFLPEKVISFFDEEQRLFFVIPMGHRTVVGTTDTRVSKPEATVNDDDRDFILNSVNRFLAKSRQLKKEDIIAERCGVRALVLPIKKDNQKKGNEKSNDWLQLSRKHMVEVHPEERLIALFGGKITDCLNIGDEVYYKLKKHFSPKIIENKAIKKSIPWYGEGTREEQKEVEAAWMELVEKMDEAIKNSSQLEAIKNLWQTWWRRYGGKALEIIKQFNGVIEESKLEDIIPNCGYCEAELRYIAGGEQVVFAEDLLRRRTKLALTEYKEDLKNNQQLNKVFEEFNIKD